MSDTPDYIYLASSEREALASWRLVTGFAGGMLMHDLGIPWPAGWSLLRMKPPHGVAWPGDIDLIAGRVTSEERLRDLSKDDLRLLWAKHASGEVRSWKPSGGTIELSFEYLVGIEVKCATVELQGARGQCPEPVLRSGKGGAGKTRRTRGQLRKLLGLGLDHVVLLDITAGIPIEAKSIGESIAWAALTTSTVDRCHPRRRDAPDPYADLPIAHYECSFAPMKGATEEEGFAARIGPRRRLVPNPELSSPDVQARRHRLVQRLQALFRAAAADGIIGGIPVVLDHSQETDRLQIFHPTPPRMGRRSEPRPELAEG